MDGSVDFMLKLTKTNLGVVLAGALMLGLGLRALAVDGTSPLVKRDPMQSEARMSRLAVRSVLVSAVVAGQRLVAVGERGHVLLSDDHGSVWRQVPVPVSVTLTAVTFVDDKQGWAVGHSGVILHSSDGGETWAKQLDGRQALEALQAAAASGSRELQQRVERQVQDGPDKPFLNVHFSDARNGLAVGAYGWAFATAEIGRASCRERV